MPPAIDQMHSAMNKLGEPFARAFAVFLRELYGANNGAPPSPEIVEEYDLPLDDAEAAEMEKDSASWRAGKLKAIEFTEDTPAQYAGQRLRHVLKAKGMTQAALAKKLGVTPAVVNRVLKNPDRSMVATLRKIAKALGVDLYEIVDR